MVRGQLGRSVLVGVLGALGSAAVLPGSLLAAILTVTDCGDTVPGGEPGQLRRLVDEAAPGDVIVVPACTVQLTGAAHLEITKSLTTPTLEQGGRVFEILVGLGPVEISDLTVAGGNPSVGTGGGISNIGVLTLARVAVTGNLSRAAGGGISSTLTPQPCDVPTFTDVACSSPFAAWIEELTRREITAGCSPTSTKEFCPRAPVTRAEMAVLVVRAFGLPL
jgi:hypothetical protein